MTAVPLFSFEVIDLVFAHVESAPVFAKRLELVGFLNLVFGHPKGNENDQPAEVAIEVGLRLDVGRVLDTLASAKNLISIEGLHQEAVLRRKAEHVELILVISELHGALAEGAVGSHGQALSINLGGGSHILDGGGLHGGGTIGQRSLECVEFGSYHF